MGLLVVAAGCGSEATPDRGQTSVVATVYPMYEFAQIVAGPDADVESLLAAGAEAHSFEPTSSDIQRLAAADLVVANGLDLEPWLDRALDALGDDRPALVVEASAPEIGVEREADHDEEHDHETDPHVWLDPVLAIDQVSRIRDAMIEVDAEHAEGYRQRADALIADLNKLVSDFERGLSSCRHDHFVTTHAAYGYLADRFALHQIAITGLSPDAEPSARDLADITEQVTELGLGHVLAEPSLSSRLAETIASESGLTLLAIHQIGSVTEAELAEHGGYVGLMYANLQSLQTALECAA